MSEHEQEHLEQAQQVDENTDVDPDDAAGQVDRDETDTEQPGN
jgi:hypothetical protein